MKTKRERFDALVSKRRSGWHEKAKYRLENKSWLDKALEIAIILINYKDENGLTQVQLAERVGVSKQYINKVLQGKENLTLETICKFEETLNISLIETSIRYSSSEEFISEMNVEKSMDVDSFTHNVEITDEYIDDTKEDQVFNNHSSYCEPVIYVSYNSNNNDDYIREKTA